MIQLSCHCHEFDTAVKCQVKPVGEPSQKKGKQQEVQVFSPRAAKHVVGLNRGCLGCVRTKYAKIDGSVTSEFGIHDLKTNQF